MKSNYKIREINSKNKGRKTNSKNKGNNTSNNKNKNKVNNNKSDNKSNNKKNKYLTYDCVVIGGGAAGMMAAITAAGKGISVLIIEHTSRLGSKLLQTGNGKCNYTNLDMSEYKFQNEDKTFVKEVLNHYDVGDVLSFFEKIGVYHKSKNGYIYPHSETAASLQEALRLEVDRNNIHVLYNFNTEQIDFISQNKEMSVNMSFHGHDGRDKGHKKEQKSSDFVIKGTQEIIHDDITEEQKITIKAATVILATGSMASPKTGSDGSGYDYARMLGHTIKTPLPALVQLISDSNLCKIMAGVRSTGKVDIICDGNVIASDMGEIQYTDYGISGIPVFQVSRYAVEKIYNDGSVTARIDMLPDYDIKNLYEMTKKRLEYDNDKTVEQFFAGLLNRKLVCAVARYCEINNNDKMNSINYMNIEKLLKAFKQFSIHITGYKDYANAQVCQGGINLNEIDAKTMQSKFVPGLYFAGEVTDVDGMCGGYNLQWAWSSGYVAGESAACTVKKNVTL